MRDSYGLYIDKLQGEYKDVFQQIVTYVAAQNNDEDSVETQMGELLDAFLQAQEEEKPVSKIVGSNLESFCKNFCSQFGWKNKLLHLADRWKSICWWIFVISVGDVFFLLWDFAAGEPVDWSAVDTDFNFTGYILGFVVVGVLYTLVDFLTIKMMFKHKKDSLVMKFFRVLKVVVMIGSFILCFLLFVSEKTSFLQMPIWILFAGSGLYLAVYYILNNRRVKERRENKVSFWKEVQRQSSHDTDKIMEKKFAMKNKWRKRFGRKPLTWEEYINAEEKDCRTCEKMKILCIVLPIALCLYMVISEFMHVEVVNLADLVFGVIIVLLIEAPIMYFLWKIITISNEDRMKWITEERENMYAGEKRQDIGETGKQSGHVG